MNRQKKGPAHSLRKFYNEKVIQTLENLATSNYQGIEQIQM